jgi:ABC-2 type transport system ATP-binding protein
MNQGKSTYTPALRLDGLCKSFGRINAVDNLSLEVNPGEMVGFLGPNGAGKSTTLYMITSLVHPSAGTIEIFGMNLRRHFKKAMQQVGAMVEIPAFYDYLSALKNLQLVARMRGNSSPGQIDEILHTVGLYNRRNDKVRTFSHGMKQRLGLGATLIGNPRLLLLDEPTNGMDPEATREILMFLRKKVDEDGLTVFLSSHLLYEVEEYCERVAVINHGRLISSGNVDDILAPHANILLVTFKDEVPDPETLKNEPAIQNAEHATPGTLEITIQDTDSVWLNEFLLSRGFKVAALIPKQKNLKEFFLSITGENGNAP